MKFRSACPLKSSSHIHDLEPRLSTNRQIMGCRAHRRGLYIIFLRLCTIPVRCHYDCIRLMYHWPWLYYDPGPRFITTQYDWLLMMSLRWPETLRLNTACPRFTTICDIKGQDKLSRFTERDPRWHYFLTIDCSCFNTSGDSCCRTWSCHCPACSKKKEEKILGKAMAHKKASLWPVWAAHQWGQIRRCSCTIPVRCHYDCIRLMSPTCCMSVIFRDDACIIPSYLHIKFIAINPHTCITKMRTHRETDKQANTSITITSLARLINHRTHYRVCYHNTMNAYKTSIQRMPNLATPALQ